PGAPSDDPRSGRREPIGLDLLGHYIAERDLAPLLAREQVMGARHGVQTIEERLGESFRIGRTFQGLAGDADDHGQHVFHAMIKLAHHEAQLLLGLRPAPGWSRSGTSRWPLRSGCFRSNRAMRA